MLSFIYIQTKNIFLTENHDLPIKNPEPTEIFYTLNVSVDDELMEFKDLLTEVMNTVKTKVDQMDLNLSIKLNIAPPNVLHVPVDFKKKFDKSVAFKWLEHLEKQYTETNDIQKYVDYLHKVGWDEVKEGGRHKLHLYFIDNFDKLNTVGGFTIKNSNSYSFPLYNHVSVIVFDNIAVNGKESMIKAVIHEILHTLGAADVTYNADDIMFGYQLEDRNVNLFLSPESVDMILKKFDSENMQLYGTNNPSFV
ncbi:hypothetical protein CDIK_2522 [Cucumispora dikerogammari]|nr:hypothetical protein CDIK_2522 [Cucumispora dikerogammari]